ncbi:Hippocampus abundant transcript 1 protein [Blomia tropicalis]|nr:Hippocampus abundant transcript 1 protein [Blomia tropicalis]
MGSKRVVGAIIRSGRRSSFLNNYLMFGQHSTPSLYHALIVIFLEFFAWGLLTIPMISILSKTFPDNTFLYNGFILGVKGFLSFLSAPLIGGLSDLWGRKFFLLITVFFTCLPIPFMIFNPLIYFGLVCFSGLFAVTFSVIFAYVADVTDEHERTFAYGSVSATFALSLVTSPALGSYISHLYNDELVIVLATLIAVFDIFFIIFFVPESLPEKLRQKSISFWETADPFSSLRKAGKDRTILTLCVSVFLSYLPEAGQYSCFFVYLKLIIGFSSTEVAIFIALIGILSMFAQTILLSTFIRRFGSKNTIMIGLIFEMLQMICYGLGSNLGVIWGAGLIASASTLTYPAISAYVSNYADADKQGLVQGIITGIRGLCNGLGPCAFGLVFNLFNVDLNSENSPPISLTQNLKNSTPNLLRNSSFSSHIYGILNSTNLFSHHYYSPSEQLVPGPPFLLGAILVLLAIIVMAFIPELIQYPPNNAHYGEHSFNSTNQFISSKGRSVMSPSRLTPRTNTTNNYYYKSMHMPGSLNDDTDCSQPSDNVKTANNYPKHSPRKALLSVESSTLYIHSSTSCTLSCSDSEEKESSDDDHAIFDRNESNKSRSVSNVGSSADQVEANNRFQSRITFNNQSLKDCISSKKHHSHQMLPIGATSPIYSSSPSLRYELSEPDATSLHEDNYNILF